MMHTGGWLAGVRFLALGGPPLRMSCPKCLPTVGVESILVVVVVVVVAGMVAGGSFLGKPDSKGGRSQHGWNHLEAVGVCGRPKGLMR